MLVYCTDNLCHIYMLYSIISVPAKHGNISIRCRQENSMFKILYTLI
jgi:hypothetical protein